MKRDIRLERFFAFPPERVFRALTDGAAMGDWLMKNDFQPKVGHKFQFRAKPQGNWSGIVDCEVTELDPPRRVAYTWTGQEKDTNRAAVTTTVTWTLVPKDGGTLLRLEHAGFVGFKEMAISLILHMGWKRMMRTKLAPVIERMNGSNYEPISGGAAECH